MSDLIHAIGYRKLPEGPRRSPIWPIARTVVALALRKRATKVVLALCLGVLIGHALWLTVQLMGLRYATELDLRRSPFGLTDVIGRVEEVIASYLLVQFYFTVPAIAMMAKSAIAEDRRAGAFELYFSRPLTRMAYAMGKFLGTAATALVTLVGATALLWLMAIGIAPDSIRGDLWHIALPALTGALLGTLVLTSMLMGLSALSRRSTSVAVAFVTLVVVGAGVSESLAEAGELWGGYLSPERDLRTLVDYMLSLGSPSISASLMPSRALLNTDVGLSAGALFGFIAAGLTAFWLALRREVRS